MCLCFAVKEKEKILLTLFGESILPSGVSKKNPVGACLKMSVSDPAVINNACCLIRVDHS